MESRNDLLKMIENKQAIGLLDFRLFFEGLKEAFGIEEIYHTKMKISAKVDHLKDSNFTLNDIKYSLFFCNPNGVNNKYLDVFHVGTVKTGIRFEVIGNTIRISERGRSLFNNAQLLKEGVDSMLLDVSVDALKDFVKGARVLYNSKPMKVLDDPLKQFARLNLDDVYKIQLILKGSYEVIEYLGVVKDYDIEADRGSDTYYLPLIIKEDKLYNQ
ncbi:hypothetical protein FOC89_02630 (plasmid) [Bacillus thuringiensis]|uniref:Uncharacterized protein n=1 Tax=Bacillus thuringiensis TaxID=1428 RepID=A0A0B5NKQ6_BACTU|nr:hypothetical protein [Bacillus thuringiensis]OUB09175.1 hypothetical protein BK708_32070 [Bacillus thuringiensis serovar yunnanensis]AJG73982.1 hypothetical protein BF38_6103 [Bacillus thuringiensis]EEM74540.1 hypothetical protein bthur0010_54550 [Bacillus thuringiensis serovar pondicheriensis BGSC 4BA1]MEC2522056.1 hypothetical protein [Bacillus thuringiensis]OTX61207.1 hypothetical protein BK723_01590 [Bacillus thuringiensis serovar pondicheriensis]